MNFLRIFFEFFSIFFEFFEFFSNVFSLMWSLSTLRLKVFFIYGGRCAEFTLGGENIQSFLGQVEALNLSLRFDSWSLDFSFQFWTLTFHFWRLLRALEFQLWGLEFELWRLEFELWRLATATKDSYTRFIETQKKTCQNKLKKFWNCTLTASRAPPQHRWCDPTRYECVPLCCQSRL